MGENCSAQPPSRSLPTSGFTYQYFITFWQSKQRPWTYSFPRNRPSWYAETPWETDGRPYGSPGLAAEVGAPFVLVGSFCCIFTHSEGQGGR